MTAFRAYLTNKMFRFVNVRDYYTCFVHCSFVRFLELLQIVFGCELKRSLLFPDPCGRLLSKANDISLYPNQTFLFLVDLFLFYDFFLYINLMDVLCPFRTKSSGIMHDISDAKLVLVICVIWAD